MAWGTDYKKALQDYGDKPFNERAALRGYQYGGVDDGGQAMWSAPEGAINNNSDAGESRDQYVRSNTRFDGQDYFNRLGVVPVDPTLTENGPTRDSARMSDANATAWNDRQARSYNKFGFNFNNQEDQLRYMTGPGQFENDPDLGRVWVPQNRDSQSWNKNFMRASSRQGSAIDRAVMGYFDTGGPIKTIANAILPGSGAALSYAQGDGSLGNLAMAGVQAYLGGGSDFVNNMLGNGAPASLVPDGASDFVTGGMSTRATTFDPETLQSNFTGGPMSTTASWLKESAPNPFLPASSLSFPDPSLFDKVQSTARDVWGNPVSKEAVKLGTKALTSAFAEDPTADPAAANTAPRTPQVSELMNHANKLYDEHDATALPTESGAPKPAQLIGSTGGGDPNAIESAMNKPASTIPTAGSMENAPSMPASAPNNRQNGAVDLGHTPLMFA